MERNKQLNWTTKEQAIKKLKEDWLKHYRTILKDKNTTPEQKELARKEIKEIIGAND